MIGLIGIVLSLLLLIYLAYRGINVLLLAPLLATVAVLFAGGLPVLATYTQIFMVALGKYVAQFFPLFMLGAIFGKLMDDSGSAKVIANWIVAKVGDHRAILAVVLACAILTYGGVSLFVVAFAVFPISVALFRHARVPKRLIPGAIALGSFTFTMTALPGTPTIQNAIPAPFFGTTAFAAPGLGIIAALIMFGGGMLWLELARLQRQCPRRALWRRRRPGGGRAGRGLGAGRPGLRGGDRPHRRGHRHQLCRGQFCPAGHGYELSGRGQVRCHQHHGRARHLGHHRCPGGGDPPAAGAELDLFPRCSPVAERRHAGLDAAHFQHRLRGRLRCDHRLVPAFTIIRDAVLNISPGNPVVSLAVAVNVLAGITGSASGGLSIALQALGPTYVELAKEHGISLELMHRVATLSSGGFDALPHNGAVITLLGICGLTHRQSYADIGMVAVVIPVAALVVVIVLGQTFGSF